MRRATFGGVRGTERGPRGAVTGARLRARVAMLGLAVALAGCPSGEDLDDVDGSGYDRVKAQRACRELVDTLADRMVELCEDAAQAGRVAVAREIEQGLPGGTSCRDALRLRDEASFYDRCLPGVREFAECPESDLVLPDACLGQLYFPG